MPPLLKGGGALAAIAVVTAISAQGAIATVTLKADYRFHDNHDSSLPGAPPIADLGNGNAFATETVAGCATRVLTFPKDNGLVADTSGVITSNSKTLVMDFRLADVSGRRRLIGLNNVMFDAGVYVRDSKLDFNDGGGGNHEGPPGAIQAGQFVEVALIQNQILSNFTQIGFVNGVQQFITTQPDQIGSSPRLFKDNDPPGPSGEDSAGAVSRISFYDDGVTPADVAQIYSTSVLGNPSLCPGAGASVTGKPKARKGRGGSILIDTGVQGSCPDWGVVCNGTASVAGGAVRKSKGSLTSASFSVPPGKTQEVIFRLKKRGKKLLRERGRVKATVTVSLTGPNGKSVTVQTRGKIRYPKKLR